MSNEMKRILFLIVLLFLLGIIGWDYGIYLVSRVWSYGTFGLLFKRVRIKGKENIHKNKRMLLISNHSSLFDIYALYLITPQAVSWLAKESLFKIPFVGWMLSAIGAISIDRRNARKTQATLNSKSHHKHSGQHRVN